MERRGFLAVSGAFALGLVTARPSLAAFLPQPLQQRARTVVWTGASSPDFLDKRNWLRGVLPFDGCDLIVKGGGHPLCCDGQLSINTLTLDASAGCSSVQFPNSHVATLTVTPPAAD